LFEVHGIFRGKQRPIASNNQGQDEEAALFFTNQSEHQDITTPANIINVKMRQQLLMIDQSEHQEAGNLGEHSESRLDSIVKDLVISSGSKRRNVFTFVERNQ